MTTSIRNESFLGKTHHLKNDELINNVVHDYSINKINYISLSSKYKVSLWTISEILKRNNVKKVETIKSARKRKWNPDNNFFSIIDTEEKAYFLGLMFADGCVSNPNNKYWHTSISLVKDDSYLLEKLSKLIYNVEKPLHSRPAMKRIRQNGKVILEQPCCQFYVYGKEFADSLILNGCHPRKSLNLEFPSTVPNELIHHFIRGYFDGDGSIGLYYKGKRKDLRLSIVSSENFILKLVDLLKTININLKCRQRPGDKVFYAFCWDLVNIKMFYDYIYQDASIFLKRKKDIFQKIIKVSNKKIIISYLDKILEYKDFSYIIDLLNGIDDDYVIEKKLHSILEGVSKTKLNILNIT